jgi:hypothetical protein
MNGYARGLDGSGPSHDQEVLRVVLAIRNQSGQKRTIASPALAGLAVPADGGGVGLQGIPGTELNKRPGWPRHTLWMVGTGWRNMCSHLGHLPHSVTWLGLVAS